MFSKSMTLTAAVVVVGVAVPATTLASPVGAGAPASGDDQPVQALPFSDAVVSANTANEHRAQTLPFSDAVVSADAPQAPATTRASVELPFSDAALTAQVNDTALASRLPTELAQRSPVGASPTTAASDSGFDWGDAGIGALASLALAGMAAGGYMQLRRGQRPAPHPTGS
jgi:hypothetical protein